MIRGFGYLFLWAWGCLACVLFRHKLRLVHVGEKRRLVCYRCSRDGGWWDV